MSDERYISIAAAAKAVGMSRGRMREVCISGGVAVRWGGTDEHPYLKVTLADAWRAVRDQRYVPPKPAKRLPSRRLVGAVTHPDVTC